MYRRTKSSGVYVRDSDVEICEIERSREQAAHVSESHSDDDGEAQDVVDDNGNGRKRSW
jgi:hypothetical protein